MSVVAKMCVVNKEEVSDGAFKVVLTPVYSGSPENEQFYKWTPGGMCALETVNRAAADQFEIGGEYYLTFTLATSVHNPVLPEAASRTVADVVVPRPTEHPNPFAEPGARPEDKAERQLLPAPDETSGSATTDAGHPLPTGTYEEAQARADAADVSGAKPYEGEVVKPPRVGPGDHLLRKKHK